MVSRPAGRILNGPYSVAETRFSDGWHMLDGPLMTFFPSPTSGVAASVDEISSAVDDWLKQHPDYRKNSARLVDFMRQDGWMGYKKAPGAPSLIVPITSSAISLPGRTDGMRRWSSTTASARFTSTATRSDIGPCSPGSNT